MALVGVELETLVSESEALTTRPPPCAKVRKICRQSILISLKRLLLAIYDAIFAKR